MPHTVHYNEIIFSLGLDRHGHREESLHQFHKTFSLLPGNAGSGKNKQLSSQVNLQYKHGAVIVIYL